MQKEFGIGLVLQGHQESSFFLFSSSVLRDHGVQAQSLFITQYGCCVSHYHIQIPDKKHEEE